MAVEAIRVRLTSRDNGPISTDPRTSFWSPLRESPGQSNVSITQFEAKLCREFGPALSSALVEHLSEPLRAMDSHLFPSAVRELERLFFHLPEREWYRYQVTDVLSKLLEQRQQEFRENPSLRVAQDRIAAAAAVTFATRIVGYSSLMLDVTTGSFPEIVKAFDGNFDSFRVFLDVFIPVALADVFSEEFADRFDFNVAVPTSAQKAFETPLPRSDAASRSLPDAAAQTTLTATGRERAEWLWRLANGSLLVPVLLSLFVMYYGLKMLSDFRSAQFEAIRPILDHQIKLLEQDRLRLVRDPPTGSSAITQPTKAAPIVSATQPDQQK